jgi:hypothetical protein
MESLKAEDGVIVEGDTIVIYDDPNNTNSILKHIRIITSEGEKRYRIIRTKNGGFLMN